jgi:hypothetical protein
VLLEAVGVLMIMGLLLMRPIMINLIMVGGGADHWDSHIPDIGDSEGQASKRFGQI